MSDKLSAAKLLVIGAGLGFDLDAAIDRSFRRLDRGKPKSECPGPEQIVSYASDTRQQRRARERAARKASRRRP